MSNEDGTAISFFHRARQLGRRGGIDVSRYPDPHGPGMSRARALDDHGVDLVVDIGAARGEYGAGLRLCGYEGAILSCEPLPGPYEELARRAAADQSWTASQVAVGDHEGSVDINVAANSDSSSILPMLDQHRASAPGSGYQGVETARLTTVDTLLAARGETRPFLKLDVQGHESVALDGAAASLDRVVGVQIELSLVPLYEGQALAGTLFERMTKLGLELWYIEPGFTDPRTGRMLQADGTFFRS